MQIFLASDHAGYELKQVLVSFLRERGDEVEDMGPYTLASDDDYPDFMFPLATKVAQTPGSLGIAVGGSGQGEAMAANRIKGIRAAVYYGLPKQNPAAEPKIDAEDFAQALGIVKLSREHNDANILSLGARFISESDAKEAVDLWLKTPFSGDERHVRRIAKLDQHD
ncbi:MAG: RpiB/LacA/LacB family sugar-phosphate isomerase [Candidatus Adlerbacteria bacterium]|nr:RpiB/LacA/LacB family sugar-phosphate isomerase [Candidatus Adlerbacteria bacterium]